MILNFQFLREKMLQHPLSTHLIPLEWQSRGSPSPNFSIVSRRSSGVKLSALNNHNTLAFNNISGGKGMNWFHEIKLEVRDHEVDRYGVVKDSIYANYCEYGQFQLFKDEIGAEDEVLAITEMSFKYIAPLRRGDRFVLNVKLYDYSATRLYFENLIVKQPNLQPILEAKSTIVCLDKNYRPVRISRRTISKFNQFLVQY
ncbi:hypothetical protein ABFS82_13G061400 [Erythranthe guttata]|uniref:uncharacterized protein LOC105957119 isoform X2 n=1 Tax=Erythranthe guttata TaxID=4155 RepID=UPI00064DDBE0|nr:PREDICTED: uncharacterized protein LOC105957119 isoform X2 [Erythranthe guttata]|eukprot:XP_012836499.1 PREDICTED: uncharacterized protein LOC105957119 isoform X2 [Erythranthe guttata]